MKVFAVIAANRSKNPPARQTTGLKTCGGNMATWTNLPVRGAAVSSTCSIGRHSEISEMRTIQQVSKITI